MHVPPLPTPDRGRPAARRADRGRGAAPARQAAHDRRRRTTSPPPCWRPRGSVLTNKYSEGYAGKRYYEGQQFIDPIETLAVERAKALFGVDHANVQPYSGSPGQPRRLPGVPVTRATRSWAWRCRWAATSPTAGRCRRPASGSARCSTPSAATTGRIDMDEVRDLARRERPKMIFCGGTAIPRTIDFPAFAEIAREVGAVLVADIAHIAGLVAGGAHPSPGRARRRHHDHHAQDAARPARRHAHDHGRARDRHRQGGLPRPAGRPAQPHHRRHRGRAARGGPAVLPHATPTRSWPTPRRWRPR